MSGPILVEFGGWLIFDGFPDYDSANRFARFISDEYARRTMVNVDNAEAVSTLTLFPFEVALPVVLVERDEEWTHEEAIEAAVARFGGRFAGT